MSVDTQHVLREWAEDDIHIGQSARHFGPTFRNPGELRAAVRELLAEHAALAVAAAWWRALYVDDVCPDADQLAAYDERSGINVTFDVTSLVPEDKNGPD